eukprot:10890925-Prorocentrum_lima.AAC.1
MVEWLFTVVDIAVMANLQQWERKWFGMGDRPPRMALACLGMSPFTCCLDSFIQGCLTQA